MGVGQGVDVCVRVGGWVGGWVGGGGCGVGGGRGERGGYWSRVGHETHIASVCQQRRPGPRCLTFPFLVALVVFKSTELLLPFAAGEALTAVVALDLFGKPTKVWAGCDADSITP